MQVVPLSQHKIWMHGAESAMQWGYANVATNPTWLYRGYTGHEHLSEFNLINMNARLYDPVLGRMLSPDNYVSVGGSQGMNRYTYANNNPLKYTDPDGNCPVCPLIAAMVISGGIDLYSQVSSKGWNNVDWGQVGGMAIIGGVSYGAGSVVAGLKLFSAASIVTQQVVAGATSGFLNGYASGIMNHQTGFGIISSATSGAISGALVSGVLGTIGSRSTARPVPGGNYVQKGTFYETTVSTEGTVTGNIADGGVISEIEVGLKKFSYETHFKPSSFVSGWAKIYRAVSKAELDDVLKNGIRGNNGYVESKLFAPTIEEAVIFGKNNYLLDLGNGRDLPNHIIEILAPNKVLTNATFFTPDGMRAIDISKIYFPQLSAYELNYSPLILKK
jgi:RHS repeat-associated protein